MFTRGRGSWPRSAVPVLDGTLLEKGAHIVNIGGSGVPDAESLKRGDVYLRFGDAPAPIARPETLGPTSELLLVDCCMLERPRLQM